MAGTLVQFRADSEILAKLDALVKERNVDDRASCLRLLVREARNRTGFRAPEDILGEEKQGEKNEVSNPAREKPGRKTRAKSLDPAEVRFPVEADPTQVDLSTLLAKPLSRLVGKEEGDARKAQQVLLVLNRLKNRDMGIEQVLNSQWYGELRPEMQVEMQIQGLYG